MQLDGVLIFNFTNTTDFLINGNGNHGFVDTSHSLTHMVWQWNHTSQINAVYIVTISKVLTLV